MKTGSLNYRYGFTIIELIVVIAIISVLAAIVLVNVTGYINKGKDAAIKGNLSSLMVDAAVILDSYGSYDNPANVNTYICGKTWTVINAAIYSAGGAGVCGNSADTWCASATLKANSGNSFCVDYTGLKKEAAAEVCDETDGVWACP